MAKQYETAETAEVIASGLIPNYHPELAEARILYVFTDKGGSKNGRELWGKAKKVSGIWEWAIEKDFVVELAKDKWVDLTDAQKRALVDHLLECCHGEADEESGEMRYKIRDPEVQEFSSILQRHGIWHDGLASFVSVAQQIDAVIEQEAGVDLSEGVLTDD